MSIRVKTRRSSWSRSGRLDVSAGATGPRNFTYREPRLKRNLRSSHNGGFVAALEVRAAGCVGAGRGSPVRGLMPQKGFGGGRVMVGFQGLKHVLMGGFLGVFFCLLPEAEAGAGASLDVGSG